MVILAGAIAAGCSRGSQDEESSVGGEDTAAVDPCEVPPEPSDYVNADFANTACTFTGFPTPKLEHAAVLHSLPDERMQYQALVENDVLPNTALYVEWYEERGPTCTWKRAIQ